MTDTIALRECTAFLGCCGVVYGIALWPWSGEAVTYTSGVCPRCAERIEREMEAA